MPAFLFISHLRALTSYAVRDVLKSRVVLLLIVVSLSIAYSAVFLSSSILAGYEQLLVRGAQGYLADIVISPTGTETSIPRIKDTLEKINAHPNIASTSVRSDIGAGFTYNDKDTASYRTVGIDPISETQTSDLSNYLIAGQWIMDSKPDHIVVGKILADYLSGLDYDGTLIDVGEKVTLNTSTGQQKTYVIGGIIDAKSFLPNAYAILTKQELESLSGSTHDSEIIIKLKNPSQTKQTIQDLSDSISGISAISWQEEAGYISDIIDAVRFITGLTVTLITISVFVIMSVIIFINVFQKRRQIGIMKSMGATNAFIVSIYVLEAMIYASLSYLVGFGLYWTIHQYSIAHPIPQLIGEFHTVFRPDIIYQSLFALLAAAMGGSVVPSYFASKTKIVNVIRETV